MPIQVREDTDSFQSLINKALVGKPCHSVDEKGVFFAPFGEDHEPGNHLGRVMKHLNDYVSPDGPRVHVGVAGGFNFSIAAKTRPDCILLLDMNQRQAQFWGKVIELLKANPSRDEFANACRVFIENSPDFSPNLYDINSYTHRQYPDFADWIEDSDAYAYLHQLACDGHIAVATLDLINDTEACAAIGSALKQHGLTVDTCYWSNVGSYIQPYPTHRRQDIPQRPAFSNGMFNTKESDAKDPKQRPVKKGLKEGLIYPTTSFFEASGDASGQKHDVLWDGHNVPIEVVPGVKYPYAL